MAREFRQVDVFTEQPYRGNPVAVVVDGSGIDDETMQAVASWTNLSETTFILPPTVEDADYRVRIFTPGRELPFAGHPTLGTCHAWLESGGSPRADDAIVQQCPAGLVRLRRTEAGLAFAAPPVIRSGDVDEELVERIAEMLGLRRDEIVDSQWVDNGPGWVAVLLRDADAVLAVRPGLGAMDVGVVGLYGDGNGGDAGPAGDPAVELRAFFQAGGATVEDPVTGSLNASVAEWLLGSGRLSAPYVASQGTALGRRGRVHISTDADGAIWVGGGTVTCVSGVIEL